MANDIQQWQDSVSSHHAGPSTEPSSSTDLGLASRLTTSALELFGLLLDHARAHTSQAALRALEREHGHLRLWSNGYGVVSGQLDVVLGESKRLRHSTYRLLGSICQVLSDKVAGALLPSLDGVAQQSVRQQSERTSEVAHLALSGVHQDDDSDSASDSGSESSFGGSVACVIEDAIEDLKTDIQCLVDLGPRYKEPVRDKEAAKEEAAPLRTAPIWDPAEYLASRIRHRYPEGDAEFTRILGRANWDRLQRLYASKDANARDREAQQRPSLAQTQLSGPPATVKGTEFHDSGLGTSVKTPSSYAETVLSYQGAQGGSVKIPPVPPECLKGGTLVCDICGVMCSLPASNPKSFWKKHVLSDLQPYVCVMATCNFSMVPFPDKRAWTSHLGLEHGLLDPSQELQCPLCQAQLQSGKVAHLSRHLEEISLTILPVNAPADDELGQDCSGYESGQDDAETSTAASPDSGDDGEAGAGPVGWSEAVAMLNFGASNNGQFGLAKGETVWVQDASWRDVDSYWVEVWRHDLSAHVVVPRESLILTTDAALPTAVKNVRRPASRKPHPPAEWYHKGGARSPSPPKRRHPPRTSRPPPPPRPTAAPAGAPGVSDDSVPFLDVGPDRVSNFEDLKRRTSQFLQMPTPGGAKRILGECPHQPCPYISPDETEMQIHVEDAHNDRVGTAAQQLGYSIVMTPQGPVQLPNIGPLAAQIAQQQRMMQQHQQMIQMQQGGMVNVNGVPNMQQFVSPGPEGGEDGDGGKGPGQVSDDRHPEVSPSPVDEESSSAGQAKRESPKPRENRPC